MFGFLLNRNKLLISLWHFDEITLRSTQITQMQYVFSILPKDMGQPILPNHLEVYSINTA